MATVRPTPTPAGMSEAEQQKYRFVKSKLLPMLKAATRGFVVDAEYWTSKRTDDEMVEIHTRSIGVLEVNVTCDSEWAIVKDVMKALASYYE